MSILSLPVEMLCSVFLELYSSLTSDSPSRYLPYKGRYSYELLDLLLVCRSWHALILDASSLWTSLLVETDDQSRWIKFATTCLDRNKGAPLDITITRVTGGTLNSAMEMTLPHVDRWRSLSVIGTKDDVQLRLDKLGGLEFPRLVSLTLHPSASGSWDRILIPDNLAMPSLQHLSFGGVPSSLISSANPPSA
ncbi:hypothetical protein FRB99_005124 [Tulasnella sp. 403]|nr:hypothetical protein FRB99_005124 [Tulasnella sp. 403]